VKIFQSARQSRQRFKDIIETILSIPLTNLPGALAMHLVYKVGLIKVSSFTKYDTYWTFREKSLELIVYKN
jgi:hypothetical protein